MSISTEKVIFVIGAQKSGTTWLREKLLLLHEFSLSKIKELHYYTQFSTTYEKSWIEQHRYDQLFDANNDQIDIPSNTVTKIKNKTNIDSDDYLNLMGLKKGYISCDFSPEYSVLEPNIYQRILNDFPNSLFVYILRNPIDRALSQLRMQSIEIFDKDHLLEIENHTQVLKQSNYKINISNIKKYIPAEKILLMNYDEIRSKPLIFLNQFLGFCQAKELSQEHATSLNLNEIIFSHSNKLYESTEKIKFILSDLLKDDINYWHEIFNPTKLD